jgi:hypothetical protein
VNTMEYLHSLLKMNFRGKIDVGKNELLARIELQGGRKQTVHVLIRGSKYCDANIIELKSRCCVVRNATFVRAALKRNMVNQIGGFALNQKTSPPVIDLIQRILIPHHMQLNPEEITQAVTFLAWQADLIERNSNEKDQF